MSVEVKNELRLNPKATLILLSFAFSAAPIKTDTSEDFPQVWAGLVYFAGSEGGRSKAKIEPWQGEVGGSQKILASKFELISLPNLNHQL